MDHALLSPSGAYQRKLCPASLAAQFGKPRSSSQYAAEGTVAHEVAALCFQEKLPASAFIGRTFNTDGFEFEVDDDMAGYVQTYVDSVKAHARGGAIYTEVRVNHASFLDVPEEEAWGTSDNVVLVDSEIQVHDLKFGRGVAVSPVGNEQAISYALGTLNFVAKVLGDYEDYEKIRVFIHQVRNDPQPAEWEIDIKELLDVYLPELRESEQQARRIYVQQVEEGIAPNASDFGPDEDACKFCAAKPCAAMTKKVSDIVFNDFDVLDTKDAAAVPSVPPADGAKLARQLASVELVRQWADAVEAHGEAELHKGHPVPGYKLVQGKRGNRAWADKETAEATLKSMRLKQDQMYSFTLITPTAAEKFVKAGDLSDRQWKKLEAMIVQKDGSPTVVKDSDKRPAIVVTPVSDDFDNLSDPMSDLA